MRVQTPGFTGVINEYQYLNLNTGETWKKCREDRPGQRKRIWWERDGHHDDEMSLFNDDLFDDPRYNDHPVVIVEGEEKAKCIIGLDYFAVCFSGSSSQRGFHPEALARFADRDVYIWPDNDLPGLKFADHLVSVLREAGARSIHFVEPVFSVLGADVADLLTGDVADHRAAKLLVDEWLNGAIDVTLPPVTPSESVSAADMDEPPPRRWLIEGIIPERWPTILYGDGGVGKTTLSNHLATCLALGLPWFGRTTTPCNVLVVDAELDAEEFARRMWPIARGLGLPSPPRGVFYWRLPGPLGDDEVVDRLFAIADHRGVRMIVIDSLTLATYSSDQYVANDLAAVIFRFTRQGIATLFLDHHARQGRMDEGSRVDPYGSVMKRNLARSSIYLQTSGPGMVRLSSNKASFASQWEPFTTEVRFQGTYPDEVISYHALATNDPRLAQAESRSKDDEIMDAIQAFMEGDPEEYGVGVDVPTLANVVKGLNRDAIRMRCMRLEKSHRLIRPTAGKFAIPYLVRSPTPDEG